MVLDLLQKYFYPTLTLSVNGEGTKSSPRSRARVRVKIHARGLPMTNDHCTDAIYRISTNYSQFDNEEKLLGLPYQLL